ncbi:MAG: hypothetical protein KF726_01860 [Anaerolineae bacterium]|nr:hypothetical protein [Anaerolineae bacterium]
MTAITPTKRRRRIGLFIGALIVVLIAVVGGVALLLSTAVSGAAASSNGTPGIVATATLVASLCSSGAAPAQYAIPQESAGADFPCPPTRGVRQVSTPLGNIEVIYYVSELEGIRYEVMISDYGTVFGGDLTGILRAIVMDRTRASTLEEYLMQERSKEEVTLNNSSGVSVSADDGKLAVNFKLYVVGKKLYRIAVVAPLASINDPLYASFLDSFTIPDAK